MLWKSTLREIRTSIERYLAILAIVALGVSFFTGLQACKPSMIATCDDYLTKTNFYDYQLITSYGIDDESVKLALANKDVEEAEASLQVDAIATVNVKEPQEENYRFISMPKSINMPQLSEGRMPQKANECVLDNYLSEYKIGQYITIADSNSASTAEKFSVKKYKIVGLASSPLFLDYQRGSTDIGDGNLDYFVYVNKEAFSVNYYSQLYVKLKNGPGYFDENAKASLLKKEDSMKKLTAELSAARKDAALADAEAQIASGREQYESGLAQFNAKKAEVYGQLDSAYSTLYGYEETLPYTQAELEATIDELNATLLQVDDSIVQLEDAVEDYTWLVEHAITESAREKYQAQLDSYKAQLSEMYSNKSQLEAGIAQAEDGLKQVESGIGQIDSGWDQYISGKKQADSEFAAAQAELDYAKNRLDDAQKQIDEMNTGQTYVLTRYENSGFSVFEENSNIVSNIAKVFPVFFFLIAALVCMTTMTRMVDEQRTQIGIMKALGYSNKAVLGKYMFYSGSAAVIGSIVGALANRIFPICIWKAYNMMYAFSPHLNYQFNPGLALIATLAALICTTGATWASCYSDFGVAPAELIRPKTPPAGKRILLERIPAIWSRLSFLRKVSFRNIFRYKKRFLMMVIGVSGCMALLVAAMGLNSSIKQVAENQYSGIETYDYKLYFNEDMDASEQADYMNSLGKTDKDMVFIHQSSAQVKVNDENIDMNLIATDAANFQNFIKLHDGDTDLKYPGDGEIVISRKLQKQYDINVGDTITVREDMREMKVKVSGVCDNYVFVNAYVNKSTYEKGFGKVAEVKNALVKCKEGTKDDAIRKEASTASESSKVVAVIVTADTIDMVAKMMKSLNGVVVLIVASAALLAFIVLYNLTNINITERIREIATIKVLGFRRNEVYQYVFRENIMLTAISVLVGIPLGKILMVFVMNAIQVNMMYFEAIIKPWDYAAAAAMTFVFAFLVNLVLRKRLDNISMTESLKSVE